ncbi:GlsB/YeaQ/YmgE family stress response membrane protein [Oceanimonas sp. NS1]|nr:GlsB/YeaQ/YmgE family stress response membrane protein [Oceanimonas sp. NS1]
MGLLWGLIIGGLAGWIAGNLMKGQGFGLLGNIAVGLVGGFLGGLVFRLLGLAATGIIGSLVMSVVGAVLLLFIVGKIKADDKDAVRGKGEGPMPVHLTPHVFPSRLTS